MKTNSATCFVSNLVTAAMELGHNFMGWHDGLGSAAPWFCVCVSFHIGSGLIVEGRGREAGGVRVRALME